MSSEKAPAVRSSVSLDADRPEALKVSEVRCEASTGQKQRSARPEARERPLHDADHDPGLARLRVLAHRRPERELAYGTKMAKTRRLVHTPPRDGAVVLLL